MTVECVFLMEGQGRRGCARDGSTSTCCHVFVCVCSEGEILCFLACGSSAVLLCVCFQPACRTTCCVYMQSFMWRPASRGIIFLANPAYALPPDSIASALVDYALWTIVCMYVWCRYVCRYVCTYVRTYVFMYVCMYVCMHVCMCVCV
jgi:hypothetical protein